MKGCNAPGCDRPHHAKGHCRMHYIRLRRHGVLEPGFTRPGVKARHQSAREALISEIEFQLDAGASAKLLPARLGYENPESLTRRLYRAGRPDLAKLFEAGPRRKASQRKTDRRRALPCRSGCGTKVSRWSKTQVCYACSRHGVPLEDAA